ncbi:hypothetical protein H1R17_00515 [Flavobacterium sp. xlx-214]|uniref:hypothetical protein n=1 Tax=unclassified Flavobacterium TaxID=196869 RepID=UPI0013D3D366|nr:MULTISPECIES: hypothetical protein [unclassified Flavobacterium]MBA5791166.1 hypothetical protein [Flavobacterium sp. xlx-221]QMI83664.1 hypothetical protein H1R17_00515 [Flavobacterium sp. xlx-214]
MIYKFLLILFFFVNSNFTFGQNNDDIYKIINVTINELNPDIPIVDTLSNYSIPSKFLRRQVEKQIKLSRNEKKILRKGEESKTGILIDRNKLINFKFYNNDSIILAFKNLNEKNLEYLKNKKPFYLISKPIIFKKSKIAILNVDLIGGFGAIYILKKENDNWKIVGEVSRWFS